MPYAGHSSLTSGFRVKAQASAEPTSHPHLILCTEGGHADEKVFLARIQSSAAEQEILPSAQAGVFLLTHLHIPTLAAQSILNAPPCLLLLIITYTQISSWADGLEQESTQKLLTCKIDLQPSYIEEKAMTGPCVQETMLQGTEVWQLYQDTLAVDYETLTVAVTKIAIFLWEQLCQERSCVLEIAKDLTAELCLLCLRSSLYLISWRFALVNLLRVSFNYLCN